VTLYVRREADVKTNFIDGRRTVLESKKIYIDNLKLTALSQLITEEIALLPEDKKEEAYLEIDCYSNYDSPSYDVTICYTRLETLDETEKRTNQEKIWHERKVAEAKKVLGIV